MSVCLPACLFNYESECLSESLSACNERTVVMSSTTAHYNFLSLIALLSLIHYPSPSQYFPSQCFMSFSLLLSVCPSLSFSPSLSLSRIERFLEKRRLRVWQKNVKYDVRKVRTDYYDRSYLPHSCLPLCSLLFDFDSL